MTASRPRRRALALTTAAAVATAGLAFGLVAPASAAPAPVSAAPASFASSASGAAALSAHDTLPPAAAAKLRALLKASPLSAGSLSAREALVRSLSPATDSGTSALQRRSVSPSAVNPAPLGSVAPARVNDSAEPDWTIGSAVVGGTLYGIGIDLDALLTSVLGGKAPVTDDDFIHLEKWTDFGWKRVPADLDGEIQSVTSFDGKLYITSVSTAHEKYTTQVTSYDGENFTRVGSAIIGIAALEAAGSNLFVITQGTKHTTLATFDHGTLSDTVVFDKPTYAFTPLGDDLYTWVSGSKNDAFYRISAPSRVVDAKTAAVPASTAPTATRVVNTPMSLGGVEWNDGIYFVGLGSSAASPVDVYRFDGQSAPTVVDTGVPVSKSRGLPALGVYRGDLYIQSSPSTKHTYLYDFDGDPADIVNVGEIASPTTLTVSLLEGNGQLVTTGIDLGDGGGDALDIGLTSWVYDEDARQGDPVTSSTPTVAGTPKVGATLTAAAGDWTPTAELSYQWYSGGAAVPGATKAYHTVKAAELGAPITVTVTGTAFGSTADQISVGTADVEAGTITLRPTISGSLTAGKTVTAVTEAPKSAKQTYRWYRDGKPLAGATKSTYKITSGDRGHTLSVGVKATAAGYADASAKSAGKKVAR